MKDIHQLFKEFLWEIEFSTKLRPETVRGYADVFKTFNKIIPDLQLKDITSETITTFFKILDERKRIVGKGIIKTGVKKSTISTYWNRLSTFFNWLEKKNYIAKNPFKGMRQPAVVYEDKQFLKKEEVEKIFTSIYMHHNGNLLILKRNILMFNLLLFCGLRREELLALQIRDVDLERKIVTIRAETSKSGIIRRIPLSVNVIAAYKDYLPYRKTFTTQYLFVSSTHDRQFSYDGFKHLIAKLNDASKIKFHTHQFRHTFAVNFLKQSNNVYKLKQLMGHKDIRMTAVYLRCLPTDEMRGDIEKMTIDSLL